MRSFKLSRRVRTLALLVIVLLLIELIDELVDSSRLAALPLIRDALNLDYDQIGLLLSIPAFVANLIEPLLFLHADRTDRRRIIVLGGLLFAMSTLGYALSQSFWGLMGTVLVFYPASGMFVALSQAVLMDSEPHRREQNMARWTLAGSLGVVGGPLLLGGVLSLGLDWRVMFVGIALLAFVLMLIVARIPFPPRSADPDAEEDETPASLLESIKRALGALRNGEVRRWLILLEFSNLMLDVLLSFLALYMVDVAGVDESTAVLALSVWTGFGLLGDALLIPLLERVNGITYLRFSAVTELILFTAFLLVPDLLIKLILLAIIGVFNSGWYAILQARLFDALPGQSGAVLALGSVSGMLGGGLPLIFGVIAEGLGLGVAMWVLLLGPIALIIGLWTLPRAR